MPVYLVLAILAVLDFMIAMGVGVFCSPLLCVFLILSSMVILSGAVVWLIRQEDFRLHLSRVYLIFPLFLFVLGLSESFKRAGLQISTLEERVVVAGKLLVAQFQAGMWLVGLSALLSFVVSGVLLARMKKI